MDIIDKNIDKGKAFDWGKTSADYAKFRDIYPQEFYEKILRRKLCIDGQRVLDLGTGTGVLPRNLYPYGAKWTGMDISKEQIEQAKILSKGMDIGYYVCPAENMDTIVCGKTESGRFSSFPEKTFDVITACQCFWYFDHEQIMPKLFQMLKPGGHLLVLYMAWLPFEDEIAGASEELVLKYSPDWSGAGETIHPIEIPDCYYEKFDMTYHEEYPLKVHFTRESWNGRMKACRGVGASLTEHEIAEWEKEHRKLLSETAPLEFDILHYGAIAELHTKKSLETGTRVLQ